MMLNTVYLNDKALSYDKLSVDMKNAINEKMFGGVKGTKIEIINANTGEVENVLHNKTVLTGSTLNACNAWGVSPSFVLPNYNTDMNLDHTEDYNTVEPKNLPIICLFCVSDAGCGTTTKDVYVASYVDRIKPVTDTTTELKPEHIMPFRYVDYDKDLSEDLRKYYFGRKEWVDKGKIGYYFKKFDTEPQLHLRYADGTMITDEMYEYETDQIAECYVQTRLRINQKDFRDYFDSELGWDKARISSLSLCYAWYDDTIDEHVWYQQITPYSLLNFPFKELSDLDTAIEFVYSVYY
jgi:hypothetical protein